MAYGVIGYVILDILYAAVISDNDIVKSCMVEA